MRSVSNSKASSWEAGVSGVSGRQRSGSGGEGRKKPHNGHPCEGKGSDKNLTAATRVRAKCGAALGAGAVPTAATAPPPPSQVAKKSSSPATHKRGSVRLWAPAIMLLQVSRVRVRHLQDPERQVDEHSTSGSAISTSGSAISTSAEAAGSGERQGGNVAGCGTATSAEAAESGEGGRGIRFGTGAMTNRARGSGKPVDDDGGGAAGGLGPSITAGGTGKPVDDDGGGAADQRGCDLALLAAGGC